MSGDLHQYGARCRSGRSRCWPGLTAIPGEIIEAARIDGAGWWARFWRVIVPLIAPILFIALLFDLIFTLTELTVVFVLTRRRPMWSRVLANYALQVGVLGGQLGQGAAIALAAPVAGAACADDPVAAPDRATGRAMIASGHPRGGCSSPDAGPARSCARPVHGARSW